MKKKQKPGRPKLPKTRSENIYGWRVYPELKYRIEYACKLQGLKTGEFLEKAAEAELKKVGI